MSELTVLDPIEKLFVNTRGQISDQFRLRKLKMRLGTVGDITAMTAEQFTGLFGSDYMRVVGNRLRKTVWISARWRIPLYIVRGWMTPISVSACIRLVSAHWRNCLKYPWLNSCIIWPDCGSPAVSNIPVGSRFPSLER